jgi:hypothetical protein
LVSVALILNVRGRRRPTVKSTSDSASMKPVVKMARARESTRGTTMSPARPPHTANASSSAKALPACPHPTVPALPAEDNLTRQKKGRSYHSLDTKRCRSGREREPRRSPREVSRAGRSGGTIPGVAPGGTLGASIAGIGGPPADGGSDARRLVSGCDESGGLGPSNTGREPRMTMGDDDRRPRRRRSPNVLAAALAAGTAVAITALASCGAPPSRPRHRGDLGEVFDREEETCP